MLTDEVTQQPGFQSLRRLAQVQLSEGLIQATHESAPWHPAQMGLCLISCLCAPVPRRTMALWAATLDLVGACCQLCLRNEGESWQGQRACPQRKRFSGFPCTGLCDTGLCLLSQGCSAVSKGLNGPFRVPHRAWPCHRPTAPPGPPQGTSFSSFLKGLMRAALPAQGPEGRQPYTPP